MIWSLSPAEAAVGGAPSSDTGSQPPLPVGGSGRPSGHTVGWFFNFQARLMVSWPHNSFFFLFQAGTGSVMAFQGLSWPALKLAFFASLSTHLSIRALRLWGSGRTPQPHLILTTVSLGLCCSQVPLPLWRREARLVASPDTTRLWISVFSTPCLSVCKLANSFWNSALRVAFQRQPITTTHNTLFFFQILPPELKIQ